jgi:hypothetical protein
MPWAIIIKVLALLLFAIDAWRTKSLVSAGLACLTLALLF